MDKPLHKIICRLDSRIIRSQLFPVSSYIEKEPDKCADDLTCTAHCWDKHPGLHLKRVKIPQIRFQTTCRLKAGVKARDLDKLLFRHFYTQKQWDEKLCSPWGILWSIWFAEFFRHCCCCSPQVISNIEQPFCKTLQKAEHISITLDQGTQILVACSTTEGYEYSLN